MNKIFLKLVIDHKAEDFSAELPASMQAQFLADLNSFEESTSTIDRVFQAVGVVDVNQYPLALWLAQSEQIQNSHRLATNNGWIRMDPIYLHADLTSLKFFSDQHFSLSTDEADQLIEELQECVTSLGARFHRGAASTAWYLEWPDQLDYQAQRPEQCDGLDLRECVTQGRDKQQILSLGSELQMLLHTTEINQKRQLHGELPINALWAWGSAKRVEQYQPLNRRALVVSECLLTEVLCQNLEIPFIRIEKDKAVMEQLISCLADGGQDVILEFTSHEQTAQNVLSWLENNRRTTRFKQISKIEISCRNGCSQLRKFPWWRFW